MIKKKDGIENWSLNSRKKYIKLELDIDQELVNIANEIVLLSQSVYRQEGKLHIRGDIKLKDHASSIAIIESICHKYGGRRIDDSLFAYVWELGRTKRIEGTFQVELSIIFYLSKYSNSYYIQVQKNATLRENDSFYVNLSSNSVEDDMLLLVDMCGQYYDCDETLTSLGVYRQHDISYTTDIDILNSRGEWIEKEKIEIGQILFGVPAAECHEWGKGEILYDVPSGTNISDSYTS